MDGGPSHSPPAWHRTGDTFDTLTLSPSILVVPDERVPEYGCGAHFYVRKGEIVWC